MEALLCIYIGPLLGPLVYLYTGPTIGALLCIWVWFFINKNMIKIEK